MLAKTEGVWHRLTARVCARGGSEPKLKHGGWLGTPTSPDLSRSITKVQRRRKPADVIRHTGLLGRSAPPWARPCTEMKT